jgi:hypothetical protein
MNAIIAKENIDSGKFDQKHLNCIALLIIESS